MGVSLKKASLVSSAALFALILGGCSTEGGTRLGGVGLADGSTGSGSTGTGDGSGTNTGSGGGDTGTGSGTGTGTGSGTGDTGSGSGGTGTGGTGTGTGTGSGSTTTTGLLGGVITTAGNAVLAVGDTTGNLSQPVNQTIPAATPVTGTITNVLKDTGQTLVDVGGGKKVLVSGLLGAVGDAVSITALNHVVTSPTSGTSVVGLGVGSDTQPVGTLATAGLLNAGKTATATVNGVTNTLLKDVTPGAIDNLVKLTVANNTLGGTGTPVIGAAVLSTTPATGSLVSATVLPTNGTGTLASASSPVSAVVQRVAGSAPSGGLVGVTVGNATIGSTNPAVGANVLSANPVTGSVVTATVPATVTAVGGALTAVTAPSATTPVGGVVAPVTAVLSPVTGTVNATVTPVVSTVVGVVGAPTSVLATPGTTNVTSTLTGVLKGKGN